MHWSREDMRKAGMAIAGILLLGILMVWISVSGTDAHEMTSGLATPVPGTVQATPTVDATVTALNKEKLMQEVQQLKNQNEPTVTATNREKLAQEVQQLKDQNGSNFFAWSSAWFRANVGILIVVIGGLIGLFRWFGDRQSERQKRDEERFQKVVEGLGNEKEETRAGAAITLHSYLQPGYERFYRQAFDLAVIHLRSLKPDREGKDGTEASVVTPLNKALSTIFKEAFPRARKWAKQGSPSSRRQRIKAWLKWILRIEKPFDPPSLDATGVHLDKAFLWKADLGQVWMPEAFLQGSDLPEAMLCGARLWRSDLSKANLSRADLRRADLGQANLSDANLSDAQLYGATLWGANLQGANLHKALLGQATLKEAKLSKATLSEVSRLLPEHRKDKPEATLFLADLRGADLREADLRGADLRGVDLSGADLRGADLSGADLSGADLEEANLYGAKLCKTKLLGIRLSGSDLIKGELTKTDVSQVQLTEIRSVELDLSEETHRQDLKWDKLRLWANDIHVNGHEVDRTEDVGNKYNLRASLHKADLRQANLRGADISGADISGANINGVEWKEVKKLEGFTRRYALKVSNDVESRD